MGPLPFECSSPRLVSLLLMACGRLGYGTEARLVQDQDSGMTGDGPTSMVDGGTGGNDGPRADTAPPACAVWSPFSTPTSLGVLNSAAVDWGPTVSRDELSIIFVSERSGGGSRRKLYTAWRTDPGIEFGPPTLLVSTDVVGQEDNPTLSADALTLVYDRNAGSSPTPAITTRADLTDSFVNPPADIVFSIGFIPAGTDLSGDALTLALTDAVSTFGIGVASRSTPADPFVYEATLPVPDTGGDESWPWLSDDRLELFFVSGSRIWSTRRADVGGSFPPAAPVSELDGGVSDSDPEISADGRTLYFASQRLPSVGDWDLWTATRACQP